LRYNKAKKRKAKQSKGEKKRRKTTDAKSTSVSTLTLFDVARNGFGIASNLSALLFCRLVPVALDLLGVGLGWGGAWQHQIFNFFLFFIFFYFFLSLSRKLILRQW